MKVADIEIYSGKPDFEFEPVREIEAKCEASHAFSSAPSMDEVNARLKALAAKVGANAIINVDYSSGITLTSWRALTGRGLAVKRISDDRVCPACAETIKKAAIRCRFCGEDLAAEPLTSKPADTDAVVSAPVSGSVQQAPNQEPLKSSDAMPAWVWIVIGIAVIVFTIVGMSSV